MIDCRDWCEIGIGYSKLQVDSEMGITLLAGNRLPSNAELQTITTDEQVTTDDDAADSTRRCRCCWVTSRATAAATCYGSSCYCCLQPNRVNEGI